MNKFRDRIEKTACKYRLPCNFLRTVEMYVYFDRVSSVFLPTSNFDITIDPSGRRNTAKWVELRTYTRLTEKEIREAVKILRDMQKYYFPPSFNRDIRVHKDIDYAVTSEIEGEMKKNRRKNDEGIRKYTSRETAEVIYGNVEKEDLVRQIRRRIKKERKKLFGIA